MSSKNNHKLRLHRRYQLPEVRLRFRSTEMAVLYNSQGETMLATAAFSNISHYLVLLSVEGEIIKITPDANVGWAMKANETGQLISGGNDLTIFDTDRGEFKILVNNPVAPEELWSVCVTEKLIIMGSSTPKGTVAVYNLLDKKIIKSFSPVHTHAFFTYDIIEASDGKIIVLSSSPKAIISILDPVSLLLDTIFSPAIADNKRITGGIMLDDSTFFSLTDTGAIIFSYPGFELIARIPNPKNVTFGLKTCAHAGSVIAWGANRPWLLNRNKWEWESFTDETIGDPNPECFETCTAFASLKDGSLVGLTDSSCTFWKLAKGSRIALKKTIEINGLTDGAPLTIGGGYAYGSSHAMQRFWSINLESGVSHDLGQCSNGGQANAMSWDDKSGLLFLSTYPECKIRAFDPNKPAIFPSNPGTFASIGNGLSRTRHKMLKIENNLWTTIDNADNRLSGALVRIDTQTKEVEIFPNFVTGESPGDIVLSPDGRTLYMGTIVNEVYGENIPDPEGAHILAFDLKKKKMVKCERPITGSKVLSALCFDSLDRLLFIDGPILTRDRSLWSFCPEKKEFERIGKAPDGLRELLLSPDKNEIWATAFGGVGQLEQGENCRINLERGYSLDRNHWDQKICKYLQWDVSEPGKLWCVQFTNLLCFKF